MIEGFTVEDVGEPRAAVDVARETEEQQPAAPPRGVGPTVNGWPEDELEQIGGLWQLPYELLAMGFGDRWELSDNKALRYAKRTARILPSYDEVDAGATRTAAIVGLVLMVGTDLLARVILIRRERARQSPPKKGATTSADVVDTTARDSATADRPQAAPQRAPDAGDDHREDRDGSPARVPEGKRDPAADAGPGPFPGSAVDLAIQGGRNL